MFEYKMHTQRDKTFSGAFDPTEFEAALNAHAADGWRLAEGFMAVDGATAETASSLAPAFRLRVESLTTDAVGYLALVGARWASEGPRPPLEVVKELDEGDAVTVLMAPRTVAHFRVRDEQITELWMTSECGRWADWGTSGGLDGVDADVV